MNALEMFKYIQFPSKQYRLYKEVVNTPVAHMADYNIQAALMYRSRPGIILKVI